MKVKWLSLALKDLDEIAEFIAKDNREAAKKVVAIIWKKTQLLAEHPEIGRPGRVPGTKELYIGQAKFIVPYRVKSGYIQILRVLHASREWPREF